MTVIDQSHINLIDILPPANYKRATHDELHGPCPFCGGTDRFIIFTRDNRWWCRQCNASGDAVAFVQKFYNLNFKEACEKLNVLLTDTYQRKSWQRKPQPEVHVNDLRTDYACFHPEWQAGMEAQIEAWSEHLLSNWQGGAGQYLEKRGINYQTALVARLGLNSEPFATTLGDVEVHLPRGITIPWLIDGVIYNVRVRRSNRDLKLGMDKYMSSKGAANGMYRAGMIFPDCTIIMTEGEFDALVLERELSAQRKEDTVAVSIGSNTGAHVLRWVTRVSIAQRVILAFDADEAGKTAALWWMNVLGRNKAERIVPEAKDITEMWQQGLLTEWVGRVA